MTPNSTSNTTASTTSQAIIPRRKSLKQIKPVTTAQATFSISSPTTPISPAPPNSAGASTGQSSRKDNPACDGGGGDGGTVLPSPAPSEGRPSPAAVPPPENHPADTPQNISRVSEGLSPQLNAAGIEAPTEPISKGLDVQSFIQSILERADGRPMAKRRRVDNESFRTPPTQPAVHSLPLTPVTSPGLPNRLVLQQAVGNVRQTSSTTALTLPQTSTHTTTHPPTSGSPLAPAQAPAWSRLQVPPQPQARLVQQAHQQSLQTLANLANNHQTGNYPSRMQPLTNAALNTPPYPMLLGPLNSIVNQPPAPCNGPTVTDYIESVGGVDNVPHGERVRIESIIFAISGRDWGFLVLHQLYCLTATAQDLLDKSSLFLPECNVGYDFLTRLIPGNLHTSRQFLEFFSKFPKNFRAFLGKQGYVKVMRDVIAFLQHGPPSYKALLQVCLRRRTPPTAEELSFPPFAYSPVVQKLVFRYICICLEKNGIDTLAPDGEEQFISQQYDLLIARGHIPPPHIARAAQQRHAQLANQPSPARPPLVGQNQVAQSQVGVTYSMPGTQLVQNNQQPPPGHANMQHHILSMQASSHTRPNQLNSSVSRQQTGQHTPQQGNRVRQTRVVHPTTGQTPPLVQSPLASTVQTPRLPGNFTQTSVRPNVVATMPTISSFSLQTSSNITPDIQPQLTLGHIPNTNSRGSSVATPGAVRESVQHYISVVAFAAQDFLLPRELPCTVGEFEVTQEVMSRIAPWTHPPPATVGRSRRTITDRSLIFRLRCVKNLRGQEDAAKASNWVLRETTWPVQLFIQLNQEPVQLQRKNICGVDSCIDITNTVKQGKNQIKVVMLTSKANPIPRNSFLLRIEVLEARSYPALVDLVNRRTIDKETAKAAILNRLKPSQDDEVVLQSSELTLSIVCPYTMTLMKTPVRGIACLHTECFDLDNYLTSWPRKKALHTPVPDSWKCPICAGDARPQELVVDGFIQEVVGKVKEMDVAGDLKDIIVRQDGSWELKVEEKVVAMEAMKDIEFITIDDD